MSRSWIAFLRLFLSVAVLICLGAYLFVDSLQKSRLIEIRADETLNVSLGAAMLDKSTQGIRDDLDLLAHLNGFEGEQGYPDIPRMEKTFVSFLHTRPTYDQVRWIDVHGKEIVRVDLMDGHPSVVASEALQNKADRNYFIDGMKLEAGQVYISPIDLNVEHGKIEVPHKPMLRLLTPLADRLGNKLGILVLNYRGNEMIAHLELATRAVADHLMLVNEAGYFIHSPNPDDEWGFMFNDAERSLAARFPDSWQRFLNEERGQFTDGDGLWTFQSLNPLRLVNHGTQEGRGNELTPQLAGQAARRWLVVGHLTPAQLASVVKDEWREVLPVLLLLLGILAAGAWAVVRAGLRENRAENRFRVYFERAMIGMALTSPDKRWLAVNPALCRILGCPVDALIGKTWTDLTHPDDLAANQAQFDRVLRGEAEAYELEKRFIRADGQTVETSIATQVVRKDDGRPDYFMVIVEDISQRVAAQKMQQKFIETFGGFIDHLPGAAYIKDQEGRILVANSHFQEIIDAAPESQIGHQAGRGAAGDAGQEYAADKLGGLTGGQAEVVEECVADRVYETTHFLIPHDAGPSEIGGIMMDITARKQSVRMLEMQARRAAALLDLPEKSVDLEEAAFMSYVLDLAEELTGSKIGFMHFVDADGETIELAAWSTQTLDKYCQAAFDNHYPLAQAGIWADSARQNKPVVINDYATAENTQGLPAGHSMLARLISVPVMEEGKVRMVTGVGNKDSHYAEEDVETVQLLGNEAWRIVRRQRAERALKIANQVVNASPVVCFRWAASEGWPVLFVSENVRQWGFAPADLQSGRLPFAELVHPDDLNRVVAEVTAMTTAGSGGYEQEYRIVSPENRLIWVVDRTSIHRDAAGKILFYDGVLTDITERKTQQLLLASTLVEQRELNRRLEEAHNQLLQSEKMASIGQLAAGVAHELNNPIGFVHSNLGTLETYVRDLMELIEAYDVLAHDAAAGSPLLSQIELMREQRDFDYIREDIGKLMLESKDGLARVRKIVLDLKSFAHVSEQEWEWSDLHQGLDSTLNIVWNELKYKCKVVKAYGDLPKVNCMMSQLNQVFMNLLVNAGHAIEKQGVITLRTVCLGDNEICVEVSDTGKGIAAEHLTRIFEPFFTTKPVGTGTGLGLSLSYGIVDKHHGRIEVESTLGQGTTFRVILPINQDAGVVRSSQEALV